MLAVFVKDFSLLENKQYHGNFGNLKVFASKSNPYPSISDYDFNFDLNTNEVVDTIEVHP